MAAILNNLFKQVRAHKLRARGTYPAPGLSNPLADRMAAILSELRAQLLRAAEYIAKIAPSISRILRTELR